MPSISYIIMEEDIQFYTLLVRMRLANADAALVARGEAISSGSVVGIIDGEQIAKTVSQRTEFFPVVKGTMKKLLYRVRKK